MASDEGKTSIGAVLVVLLALAALGGWNYHRNYQAELVERGPNAFAGYSDENLEGLRGAYQAEVDSSSGQYEALKSRRSDVRAVSGVGDGVRQFEQVQKSAKRLREVTTGLAANEARVREIEEEQQHRGKAANGLGLHFKRLTGFALPI